MQNFIQNTKFFFTDFHTGTVNITFHIVSLAILVLWLYHQNIILFILGFAVFDELGHIYNFYFLHKGNQQYNPIRMVPCQIVFVIPPALLLFYIFFI